MTDYRVDIIPTFAGSGLPPITDHWFEDDNPATTATISPGASGVNRLMFDLHADFTAITDLIGWRVEVDVVSGSGSLYWDIAFDHPSGSGYVAFGDYLTIHSGPGTYSTVAGDPYFVSSVGGHTYGGIYDVVTRMAYEVGYRHGYGQLDPSEFVEGDELVLSEFRVVFFTADTVSVVRQWPRDDSLGRNATPRRYPTPRATRRIGGQP